MIYRVECLSITSCSLPLKTQPPLMMDTQSLSLHRKETRRPLEQRLTVVDGLTCRACPSTPLTNTSDRRDLSHFLSYLHLLQEAAILTLQNLSRQRSLLERYPSPHLMALHLQSLSSHFHLCSTSAQQHQLHLLPLRSLSIFLLPDLLLHLPSSL